MLQIDDRGEEGPQFSLTNKYYSYSCFVFDARFLTHLYWGSPIAGAIDPTTLVRLKHLPYIPNMHPRTTLENWPEAKEGYSLNFLPREYPAWGTGDLREGVFRVVLADGTEASRLEYQEYEQITGACQPQQMALFSTQPDGHISTVSEERSARDRYNTLRIRLRDPREDFAVDLFYLFSEESPVLIRWARFINTGSEALWLENPASASLDLPSGEQELLRLYGSWGRERHIQRIPLSPGLFSAGSSNGASSHQGSPFLALCEQGCDESHGRVQALTLAYSGNFAAQCLVDENEICRMSIGIRKLRSSLPPGGIFDTPCAVLVYSEQGFSEMSRRFHHFIRRDILAPRWRDEPRKIIINSWEAMYFDINTERIIDLARRGREIAAELLILDDGWFSNRRDDTSSLGDWWYNPELFPEGLGALGDAVRREGLEFGLWLEPEMLSPKSKLYREHPDWALQIAGREQTESRHQLVLDLANPEVVDYIFNSISELFREARPTYIKWDMNRNMTEAGSPDLPPEKQGEVMHRYILGLYTLLERIQERFPNILIEGCAGGGGRFDLGLARFSPRFWTSDQTDAVERLPIQYGTSLVFPPEMMGAHVSDVPNHQVGRNTPAWTRCLTALPFSFGFELDPGKVSRADNAIFRQASEWFKKDRSIFHRGDFIRLQGPLAARYTSSGKTEEYAWMIRSPDKKLLLVFYFRPLRAGIRSSGFLRLHGITGIGSYQDSKSGKVYQTGVLEQTGLPIPEISGDYYGTFWRLIAQT